LKYLPAGRRWRRPAGTPGLFEKLFYRDLPEGTIIAKDGMNFELPAGRDEVVVVAP